jgi:hypothetical protein
LQGVGDIKAEIGWVNEAKKQKKLKGMQEGWYAALRLPVRVGLWPFNPQRPSFSG